MTTRRSALGGPDAKKPYHTVYGRNRYSGNLITVGTYRSLKEAQKVKKESREGSGHDYTYRISSSWENPR